MESLDPAYDYRFFPWPGRLPGEWEKVRVGNDSPFPVAPKRKAEEQRWVLCRRLKAEEPEGES